MSAGVSSITVWTVDQVFFFLSLLLGGGGLPAKTMLGWWREGVDWVPVPFDGWL